MFTFPGTSFSEVSIGLDPPDAFLPPAVRSLTVLFFLIDRLFDDARDGDSRRKEPFDDGSRTARELVPF